MKEHHMPGFEGTACEDCGGDQMTNGRRINETEAIVDEI